MFAAKHSNEHETMKGERDARYENKKYKECKKKVNKAIKYNGDYRGSFMQNLTRRFHSIISYFN
jgi:hypothetical protein